jgi:hypothetical protein
LDGLECREILKKRCIECLDQVAYFQKHLTLPRVKMTLKVTLEIYAEQPNPEKILIGDSYIVAVEGPRLVDTLTMETVDAAAPIPGGHPPDQLREMHGLPVSRPERGPREVGGHIVLADQIPHEEKTYSGLTVDRTGGQTMANIDQGPAGLKHGRIIRESFDDMRHGIPVPRDRR